MDNFFFSPQRYKNGVHRYFCDRKAYLAECKAWRAGPMGQMMQNLTEQFVRSITEPNPFLEKLKHKPGGTVKIRLPADFVVKVDGK